MSALRNPDQYQSVSAFSPISQPTNCPWGVKAFTHYLGKDVEKWQEYDASVLLEKLGCQIPILIDQGDDDEFLTEQLKPHTLVEAGKKRQANLTLRMQTGYDHSYFFIATHVHDHLQFHARALFHD